jgi:hypothetical protein
VFRMIEPWENPRSKFWWFRRRTSGLGVHQSVTMERLREARTRLEIGLTVPVNGIPTDGRNISGPASLFRWAPAAYSMGGVGG